MRKWGGAMVIITCGEKIGGKRPSVFAASSAAAAIGRTASPAASATTTATFAHRSSFIHYQRTAQKILAVAGLNGAIRFFVISKFREAESSRLTCELIANDLD